MDRRAMLNSSATMAVGAVAGCALPGTAQQAGVKTPFAVRRAAGAASAQCRSAGRCHEQHNSL